MSRSICPGDWDYHSRVFDVTSDDVHTALLAHLQDKQPKVSDTIRRAGASVTVVTVFDRINLNIWGFVSVSPPIGDVFTLAIYSDRIAFNRDCVLRSGDDSAVTDAAGIQVLDDVVGQARRIVGAFPVYGSEPLSAREPRTVAEIAELFRDFYVDVRGIIEDSGASWRVSSQGDGELVAPPVGGAATVIIRPKADRGFGLVINEPGWQLRGMRNLTYRVDDGRDAKMNALFLDELKRRLSIAGGTRTEILDAAGNNSLAHWRETKRRYEARVKTFHKDAY